MKEPSGFLNLVHIWLFCGIGHLPKNDSKLPRNSSASLQLVIDPRTRHLNNQLAQIPINPNQEGMFQMRDEVLASAGFQDMANSRYELSELEIDADFRPRLETPFTTTVFNDLEMIEAETSENPVTMDEKEDKENSPLPISESERPIEHPRLFRCCPFWRRIEIVLESVYTISLEQ